MMSTFLTKEEKDKIRPVRLSEARQYHKDLIERLGISPNDFNIKVPWKDRYGRDCVLLFDSEFLKEKGFYFEMADSNLNFHEDRKVYKVSRNTNYKDEYEKYESIYNGEVKVILYNSTQNSIEIKSGQKIAQACICPVVNGKWINMKEVTDISAKDRGDNGFGSTGI